jgi:hypothetical protein
VSCCCVVLCRVVARRVDSCPVVLSCRAALWRVESNRVVSRRGVLLSLAPVLVDGVFCSFLHFVCRIAYTELSAWKLQAAIKAGVMSVMCSYNKIHGTWACENSQTLGYLKQVHRACPPSSPPPSSPMYILVRTSAPITPPPGCGPITAHLLCGFRLGWHPQHSASSSRWVLL